MKTIVAGPQSLKRFSVVARAIEESGFKVTEIVSGMIPGADFCGIIWGTELGLPVTSIPKNPNHGENAVYMRSVEMAEQADALVAVLDGEDKDTQTMIDIAREKGLTVFVYEVKKPAKT